MSTKRDSATVSALAALGVGTREQGKRMGAVITEAPGKGAKTQLSLQFSDEGLALLRKAQARLLERGVRRAGMKGEALEVVLKEWLKD